MGGKSQFTASFSGVCRLLSLLPHGGALPCEAACYRDSAIKQVENVFSFHVVLSTVIEGLFGVVKVNSMQVLQAFAVCCHCCHTAT